MKLNGGTQVLALWVALALSGVGCTGGGGGTAGVALPVGGSTSPPGGSTSPPTSSTTPGGGTTAPTTSSTTGGGGSTPTAPATFDVAAASLGTNMSAVSYYSPQWPFVDVMRTSRKNASGYPWDLTNPNGLAAPALDAQGYPMGLGSGQVAVTYSCVGGHHPLGQYVGLFEGEGSVEVTFGGGKTSASNAGSGTARFTFDVTSRSQFIIRITRSSPSNHVRNLRLIMPGFEATHASQPFHPLFIERMKPYTVLRFMDWGETNHSPVVTWSDRKRPDYRTQHGTNGASYEVMADLCNLTKKQMWVCVPHQANDDFVKQLATLLRDRVDPKLKIFVEYSNEVWNGAFSQYKWVAAKGAAEGLSSYAWYTKRALQIFDQFEQVFGGRGRLVRVLATQSANGGVTKQILAAMPPGRADVLAIAPYFGGSLGNTKNYLTMRAYSVEQVLDACAADLANQRAYMRSNFAQAKAAGLGCVGYEGGQHLAGVGEAANDTTLTSLFIAANRHARMKQLYTEYLAAWKQEGLGTFVHFTDIYTPGKWGNWGSLERQDQDPTTAPKYQALLGTAAQWASTP